MSKNYVFLSPDYSKITIYHKKYFRTIPVSHIKEVFERIPKSTIVYKGKKREYKVDHVYLFENPITKQPQYQPNLTGMFKTLITDLKLNKAYTSHSLHHGFISYLAKKSASIFNISKIVGHSVKEITEFVYAHHTPKNLARTMSKIVNHRAK